MVWARLDDAILDNPKIVKAGVFGFAMHVAAITWCCRNLSDGFIPFARVTALLTLSHVQYDPANPMALPDGDESMHGEMGLDPYMVADHLVDVGLWHFADGGYQLHDFLEFNPSKAKVLGEREKTRRRVKRHRNAPCNGVTNAPVTPHPVPVPVPVPNAAAAQHMDPKARAMADAISADAQLSRWIADPIETAERLLGVAPLNAEPSWLVAAIRDASAELGPEASVTEVRRKLRAFVQHARLPKDQMSSGDVSEAEHRRRKRELAKQQAELAKRLGGNFDPV